MSNNNSGTKKRPQPKALSGTGNTTKKPQIHEVINLETDDFMGNSSGVNSLQNRK